MEEKQETSDEGLQDERPSSETLFEKVLHAFEQGERETVQDFAERALRDGPGLLYRLRQDAQKYGLADQVDLLEFSYNKLSEIRNILAKDPERDPQWASTADYAKNMHQYFQEQFEHATAAKQHLVEAPVLSPTRRTFLRNLPVDKLELLAKMFDEVEGFGNPARRKHPPNNGYTSSHFLKKYLIRFGWRGEHSYSEADLRGSSITHLHELLKPLMKRIRRLLPVGEKPVFAIRRMLHGEGPPPIKPPFLEPATPAVLRRRRHVVFHDVGATLGPQGSPVRQAFNAVQRWRVHPDKEREAVQKHLSELAEKNFPGLDADSALQKAIDMKASRDGSRDKRIALEYIGFWELSRKLQHLSADPNAYLGSQGYEFGKHAVKVEMRRDRHSNYNIDLHFPATGRLVPHISPATPEARHFMRQLEVDPNLGVARDWREPIRTQK